MKLVLRRPTELYPPGGGFGFVEPRTGLRFDGLHGSPHETARKIIEHRRANPHVFPVGEATLFDTESVVQEIFQQKFQAMPELFIGHGGAAANPDSGKCTCGANSWEPTYCPTCGGKRINGYRCKACGKKK